MAEVQRCRGDMIRWKSLESVWKEVGGREESGLLAAIFWLLQPHSDQQ